MYIDLSNKSFIRSQSTLRLFARKARSCGFQFRMMQYCAQMSASIGGPTSMALILRTRLSVYVALLVVVMNAKT